MKIIPWTGRLAILIVLNCSGISIANESEKGLDTTRVRQPVKPQKTNGQLIARLRSRGGKLDRLDGRTPHYQRCQVPVGIDFERPSLRPISARKQHFDWPLRIADHVPVGNHQTVPRGGMDERTGAQRAGVPLRRDDADHRGVRLSGYRMRRYRDIRRYGRTKTSPRGGVPSQSARRADRRGPGLGDGAPTERQ